MKDFKQEAQDAAREFIESGSPFALTIDVVFETGYIAAAEKHSPKWISVQEVADLINASNEMLYELRGEWMWKQTCAKETPSGREFTALNNVIEENLRFLSSLPSATLKDNNNE